MHQPQVSASNNPLRGTPSLRQCKWIRPQYQIRFLSTVSSVRTAAASVVSAGRPITPKPTPTDPATGFVANEARISQIPNKWNYLLSDVTAAYQQVCGPSLVGVYLRGSLPRGYFLPGISDVDTFAVVVAQQQYPGTAAAAAGYGTVVSSSSSSSSGSDTTASWDFQAGSGNQVRPTSSQQLQQQVKDMLTSSTARYLQLGFSKVEVKVLEVAAGTAAAAVLQQYIGSTAAAVQALAAAAAAAGQAALPSDKADSSSSSSCCSSNDISTTGSTDRNASSSSSGSGGTLPVLTPSMLPSIPAAFELKTQSVCLHGVDLPLLLPAAAALLPTSLQLLPALAEDMEAAKRKAAEAAVQRDALLQASVARWCLKRLLRAAFELVQHQCGTYTRDLYWCCHFSSIHLPQLKQQLEQALQLFVALQDSSATAQPQQQQWGETVELSELQQQRSAVQHAEQQQQQQQPGLQQHERHQQMQQQEQDSSLQDAVLMQHGQQQQQQQQDLRSLLAAAWQLIDLLLPALETLFLKQMLTEDPNWLTQHVAGPVPADNNCNDSSSSRSRSILQQQVGQQQQQQWPWAGLQQQLRGLTAATAAAGSRGSNTAAAADCTAPELLLGAVPPAVQLPIWGKVAEYDCSSQAQQASACAVIGSVLLQQNRKSSSLASSSTAAAAAAAQLITAGDTRSCCSSTDDKQAAELERLLLLDHKQQQPLVLRGVGSSWPAVQGASAWGLAWLAAQGFSGKVRVAPSLQFPFVEPQLVQLLIQVAGAAAAAPSLEFDMSIGEFVHRLQPHCSLPRLVYNPHEHYYMQAGLPEHMEQQLKLTELLQQIQTAAATATGTAAVVGDGEQTISHRCSNPDSGGAGSSNRDSRGRVTSGGSSSSSNRIHDNAGSSSSSACNTPSLYFSQAPRIWISPAGAVSPMHYDTSHSFLLQVRGYKRMLFVSPEQLYRLYCYPDTHILRRRSRVNLQQPDFVKHPLFKSVGALEVVLGPGDVVFFPSMWAHYTESLGESLPADGGTRASSSNNSCGSSSAGGVCGCSISVTFRVAER